MRQGKKITTVVLIIFLGALLPLSAWGQDPQGSDTDVALSAQKEAKVRELTTLPLEEAFKKLKDDPDFLADEDLLHTAISDSLRHRRGDAVDLATNDLEVLSPDTADSEEESQNPYIARMVLEAFPDQSVSKVLELYQNGDPITKGNVIRGLGKLIENESIEALLLTALNDSSPCEEESLERLGEPLRICDIAYNQLVLCRKIKDVLRTISPGHSIEVRDYHIGILKDLL